MIQCQNCSRKTDYPELHARITRWIVWSGTTLGGQETKRVYCPQCAGRAEQEQHPPTWDAECRTCYAFMSDGCTEDEGTFTEEDALNWKDDHECEPDVLLITPEQTEKKRLRVAGYGAQAAAPVTL